MTVLIPWYGSRITNQKTTLAVSIKEVVADLIDRGLDVPILVTDLKPLFNLGLGEVGQTKRGEMAGLIVLMEC